MLVEFHPTRDWNDVMLAAERMGLFKVQRDSDGTPWRWRLIQGITEGTWHMNPMYVDECKEVEGVADPLAFLEKSGPMAICEAILAMIGGVK